MSKKHLETIKESIKYAKKYLKTAEDTARSVGDKSGASKIAEIEKKAVEAEEHFGRDM